MALDVVVGAGAREDASAIAHEYGRRAGISDGAHDAWHVGEFVNERDELSGGALPTVRAHPIAGEVSPSSSTGYSRLFNRLFKAIASVTGATSRIRFPVGTHHLLQMIMGWRCRGRRRWNGGLS